jgi:hypothetical protein
LTFDPRTMRKERIATRCVCCGNAQLESSPAILMPFVAHRVFGWTPVSIDESWGLNTIRSGNAYSICKSLYCPDCGLVFLDIRFSDDELSNLYRDYRGDAYTRLRESYEPGYRQRNEALNAGIEYIRQIEDFLEPYLSFPLRILDWGGDSGRNTPFKDRSERLDIYDISEKPVIDGATLVSKAEAFSRSYGLVVCSNVLEHVPYPADLVLDLKNAMDGNSVLYIEVPLEATMIENGADPHHRKRHWHEHVNFYSERSLRKLLDACGLKTLALTRLHANAGGKPVSLFQIACELDSHALRGR